MKTLLLTTPQGQIETGFLDEFISAKPTEWHIEVSPSGSLGQLSISPDITIVQLNCPDYALAVNECAILRATIRNDY